MKIPKICPFTSSVALSGLYYFFERQMVLHVYLKKKKRTQFQFFFSVRKDIKMEKIKNVGVCHTCFLYPDQTLPAATEAVPLPGPARSGAGHGVGCVWAKELWVLRTVAGTWNYPRCSSQAFTCWGRGKKERGREGEKHSSPSAHVKLLRTVLAGILVQNHSC